MSARTGTVAVDMDGVQACYETGFAAAMLAAHPDAPVPAYDDRVTFYVTDQLPPEWTERAYAVANTPGFYRDLPPVAGAATAMNEMLDSGLDVIIVTAPSLYNPTCASDKIAWMVEHVGERWAERVILAKDKTRVATDGGLLIDDKPIITGYRQPDWTHVLFDTPSNRDANATHRLCGWHTWQETLLPLLSQGAA